MARYQVLHDFTDLEDKNKVYFKGDIYPNPVNKKVTKKRIDELSSNKNKRGIALIKEIDEQAE